MTFKLQLKVNGFIYTNDSLDIQIYKKSQGNFIINYFIQR